MVLRTKLAYLWTRLCLIFEIFVPTQYYCLKACLSPLSILIACGIVNKVVIFKELLSIPWWVLLHSICVLNDFLGLFSWSIFLMPDGTSKGGLVVERNLGLLFRGILGATLRESPEHWEAKWWGHPHHATLVMWRDSMWTMDHAASNRLLLLVVRLLLLTLGDLHHVLEIQEATKGISMRLSLHHGQSLLVVSSFTMYRASSDMDLLILAVFKVLLVLHMLEVLKVLIFLLIVLLRSRLLLGSWARVLLACSINVVRFDLEVLLLLVGGA